MIVLEANTKVEFALFNRNYNGRVLKTEGDFTFVDVNGKTVRVRTATLTTLLEPEKTVNL